MDGYPPPNVMPTAAENPRGPGWRDHLYRAGLLLRGPGHWHWRYYGRDYVAHREGETWQVQALGHRYRFGTLADWCKAAEAIHILLSGPSVQQIGAIEHLAAQPLIAVNGSYRLLAQDGLQADLYVVIDVGYVRRQWDAFVAGVHASKALAIDHRVALEIVRRDPQLLRGIDVRLFDALHRPYRRSSRWWHEPRAGLHHDGERVAFSLSADAGYFPSATVAYVALQIAATQKPARIALFGLDLNGGGRFYSEAQGEKTMIDQDYEQKILPDFTFASTVLRQAGIAVVNASPQSRLPDAVFERCAVDAALAAAGQLRR